MRIARNPSLRKRAAGSIALSIAILGAAFSRPSNADDPQLSASQTRWHQHISGSVLTTDGKPIANADVVVLAEIWPRAQFDQWESYKSKVVARTKSDAAGHFEVENTQPMTTQIQNISVLVSAKGYAFDWQRLPFDDDEPQYEFKLSPAREIRGQILIDNERLARGASVQIYGLYWPHFNAHRTPFDALQFGASTDLPAEVFQTKIKTNREGEIVVGRLPEGAHVTFSTPSESAVEPCAWTWLPSNESQKISLSPARVVTGTVVAADDGKPLAGASVSISSSRRGPIPNPIRSRAAYAMTDDGGHFKLATGPGDLAIAVFPPPGTPYLQKYLKFDIAKLPDGKLPDLSLKRGVLVTGHVVESSTGAAVPDAVICYWPRAKVDFDASMVGAPIAITDKDGGFSGAAPAGPGELLIMSASRNYVVHPATLFQEQNDPHDDYLVFARRWIDVPDQDPKVQAAIEGVTLELVRGATVRGQIVGADGKAPQLVRLIQADQTVDYTDGSYLLTLSHGHMAVNGVPPDGDFPIALLDPTKKQGKALLLHGSDAKQPLVVTLEPCGSLTFHVRDSEGKPVAGYEPWLAFHFTTAAREADNSEKRNVALELNGNQHSFDYLNCFELMSDEQGLVTVPTLVPGLTYALTDRGRTTKPREFTVKPGQHIELRDVILSTPAMLKQAQDNWAEKQKQ